MGGDMKIYSIFNSIDGEINHFGQGTFSTFIRMAGCNLQCSWCDTKYAQDSNEGSEVNIRTIMKRVKSIGCRKVTITGGEPLMQGEELKKLIGALSHEGFKITIETNGTQPPDGMPGVSSWIVDYKMPSSGMMHHMMDDRGFLALGPNDFIKFVITDKPDYNVAVDKYEKLKKLKLRARVAFSPGAKGMFSPYQPIIAKVIQWIKNDKLFDIIINLQLHRLVEINEEK
jgi:7-carboxy-7-deazaguanine synthase